MCSSLSQFSDPVCVALEFSSRMLGVIHAMSKSNVCLFLFVPDIHILILPYYTVAT